MNCREQMKEGTQQVISLFPLAMGIHLPQGQVFIYLLLEANLFCLFVNTLKIKTKLSSWVEFILLTNVYRQKLQNVINLNSDLIPSSF